MSEKEMHAWCPACLWLSAVSYPRTRDGRERGIKALEKHEASWGHRAKTTGWLASGRNLTLARRKVEAADA